MQNRKIQKNQKKHIRQASGAALTVLLAGTVLTASGCGIPVLSSLGGGYIFKIGSEKCPERDAKVILMNYQKDYSSLYGIDLWQHEYEDGSSLEDYVKDLTASQLAEVYTLDIIAEEQELTLSEDETAQTEAAAKEYVEGLSEAEREYLGVGEGDVQELFERYLLAKKLYTSLTESVSSEVSDDEARVMDVKQIRVSDQKTAEAIASQLEGGADFAALAAEYNEAQATEIHVTRTTFDQEISDQLFALGNGAVSPVIAMDDAYYIFYCTNAFNEAMTQENKANVLTRRMENAVNSAYASYTDQLQSELNEDVWSEVPVDTSLALEGASFMDIYEKYFGDFSQNDHAA